MRAAGEVVDRYTIVSLLGQGGMGEVYEAEDSVLRRKVALKLIAPGSDAEARDRMLREARLAAAFEHPNAVTVYDAGVIERGSAKEQTYLAMELVRGRPLSAFVGDAETTIGTKLRWLCDAARALGAAHRAGLVHRDVKPDNLMVKNDGRIKVLDFGIAKQQAAPVDASAPTEAPVTKGPITEKGSFIGTPRYAAPEQLRGEDVDGRTDQYGWGVTAYELLTGDAPFHADSPVALLSRILTDEPPKLRPKHHEIPRDVEAVVLQALAKRPKDRFDTMDEVADAIEPFADVHAPTDRRSALHSHRPGPPSTAKRAAKGLLRAFLWFAAAIGTLFIALLIIAAATGKLRIDGENTASASAAPASPSVTGFACHEAKVGGEPAGSFLTRAIGIGTCARLALETGLPFSHPLAHDAGVDFASHLPVEVEATLGPIVSVTLRAGGHEAKGEGATPTLAMEAAARALAPSFPSPPLDDAGRAAWGAKDDVSARRIERTWRRLLLGYAPDAERDARDLVASDPDSPWPHAILALVAPRGGVESQRSVKRSLELLGALSPSRAKGIEGTVIAISEPTRSEEAIKLLRQSYRDAPDDPDIAGLYGAIVLESASEEGFGVIERVAQDFPTRAIIPLTNAITGTLTRDAGRNAKYIKRLNEIHPEKACEGYQFDEMLLNGDIAAARGRLADCDRFYGTANEAFASDIVGASVELAALEPERALALAKRQLGDSREYMRSEAARLMIAALLLGGRAQDAMEALDAEMKRQRDQESPRLAIQRALALLRLNTRLERDPPAELIGFIQAARKNDPAAPAYKERVDAMLAIKKGTSKKDREAAVEALLATKSQADPFQAVGLLRQVKGDKRTWELLGARTRIHTRAQFTSALDVALLLEALDAPLTELEPRYRLAMMPAAFDFTGLDKGIARLRLARLYDKAGKTAEAAALRAEVDKLWGRADPGLRKTALELK
jgi:hypothetical protein